MSRILVALLLFGLLLSAQNTGAFVTENLWPDDDSFETGTNLLNLPRTKEQAHHGEYSLVMDENTTNAGTRNLFRLMKANQKHEFSIWVKADRDAEFEISSWDQHYRRRILKKLRATTEWKRYVLGYSADPTDISPTLLFAKEKGFKLWLDEFQVAREGKTTATYSPSRAFSLAVERIGTPGDIQDVTAAPLVRCFAIRNNLPERQEVAVSVVIQRVFDEPVTLLRKTLPLAAGQLMQQDLTLLQNCLKTGHYTVTLTAESTVGRYTTQVPFVILEAPVPITAASFAGIHSQNAAADIRAGAAWIRRFQYWRWTSEQNGVYQLAHLPKAHQNYGFNCFETVNIDVPPERYKKDDWCDPQELSRFLEAFVRACTHTDIIEIQNEPDLTFNSLFRKGGIYAAERYAQVLNDFVPQLKKIHPGLKIAASGVSDGDFDKDFAFTETVLKQASEQVDILAVHPYAHARYIGAEHTDIGPEANRIWKRTQQLKELVKKYGGRQELWFGEIGWALDFNEPFQSPAALRHADYCARLLLWAKALEMKHILYFMSDNHIERERYYYGIWRQGRPLPAVAAYSAAARLLEGATALGVPVNSDVHAALFRHRDGRLFAAVWTSQAQPVPAVIDLPARRLQARDMFGAALPLADTAQTELSLSGHPVYLFAEDGIDVETFRRKLAGMKLGSAPVAVNLQAVNAHELRIHVENLRSLPLEAKLTFSGEELLPQTMTAQTVAPGAVHVFAIHSEASLNRKKLQIRLDTPLGTVNADHYLDFVDCPRRPAVSKLPVLNSRDHLLPNDPGNGWAGPQDLSMQAVVSYDDDNLYLDVEVNDDIHRQQSRPGTLWKEDSLQIAFDTQADARQSTLGYAADDLEFGFGLCPDGPAKELTVIAEPARAPAVLAAVKADISRQGGVTAYRLVFPWKALGITPTAGRVFGMNVVAVDNDGHGRRFWMGLTPGICEAKNPYAFKKFQLLP